MNVCICRVPHDANRCFRHNARVSQDAIAIDIRRPPAPVRRRLGFTVIAISHLLVLGGTVGVLAGDPSYVWVERLLNHPFLFGCAAALLFGLGLSLLTRRRWLKVSVLVAGVTVAVAWSAVGAFALMLFGTTPVAKSIAPGGSHKVVVEEGTNVIDPIWLLAIEQRGGLQARRWEVGCISGDWNQFRKVAWRNNRVLEVSTARGQALVEIDPQTGQPTIGAERLWGC